MKCFQHFSQFLAKTIAKIIELLSMDKKLRTIEKSQNE